MQSSAKITENPKQVRAKRQLVVALAVVVNERGEVLLTQRHQPELPDAHRRWEVPGGRVEHGESTAAAAQRELLEETGYEVAIDPSRVVVRDCVWEYPDADAHTILVAHRGVVIGGSRRVEGGKVIDVRWWPPETLPRDELLRHADVFIQELLPSKQEEAYGLK